MIAQWAVNVVAYRDHNSIMIPFPYEPNPFSGNWLEPRQHPSVHGLGLQAAGIVDHGDPGLPRPADAGPQRRSGRPEASPARTTSIAARTRGTDARYGKEEGSRLQSQFRPQGSLFVELYNPWTVLEPRTADLGPVQRREPPGVELNKMTPQSTDKHRPSGDW